MDDPLASTLVVRHFDGIQSYVPVWHAMQAFTASRTAQTMDELWLLQHEPVFTLGYAGKPEHVLEPGTVPLLKTDRGGQVTFHGPGQLVAYLLLDLKRKQLRIRPLVDAVEAALIDVLDGYGIVAFRRPQAPGVYVMRNSIEHKIAALGLRVKQQGCYHGLALNIDMDTAPFAGINPCGYAGLKVTTMRELLGNTVEWQELERRMITAIAARLGYDSQHEH